MTECVVDVFQSVKIAEYHHSIHIRFSRFIQHFREHSVETVAVIKSCHSVGNSVLLDFAVQITRVVQTAERFQRRGYIIYKQVEILVRRLQSVTERNRGIAEYPVLKMELAKYECSWFVPCGIERREHITDRKMFLVADFTENRML